MSDTILCDLDDTSIQCDEEEWLASETSKKVGKIYAEAIEPSWQVYHKIETEAKKVYKETIKDSYGEFERIREKANDVRHEAWKKWVLGGKKDALDK